MPEPSREFDAFLAEDESVLDAVRGTLVDGSQRSAGWVALTERRVLYRSDDGLFVDVAHGAIHSITSRPRTALTYRGWAYRLLQGLGALVALAGVVSVVAFGPALGSLVLMTLVVGGVVGAEHVRIDDDGVAATNDGTRDLRVLGVVVLALLALVGLVTLTTTLLVVPLALVAVCGYALVEYATVQLDALAAAGEKRRHERAVSIHVANGDTLQLRVPATRRIDHEVSEVARELEHLPGNPELTGS